MSCNSFHCKSSTAHYIRGVHHVHCLPQENDRPGKWDRGDTRRQSRPSHDGKRLRPRRREAGRQRQRAATRGEKVAGLASDPCRLPRRFSSLWSGADRTWSPYHILGPYWLLALTLQPLLRKSFAFAQLLFFSYKHSLFAPFFYALFLLPLYSPLLLFARQYCSIIPIY